MNFRVSAWPFVALVFVVSIFAWALTSRDHPGQAQAQASEVAEPHQMVCYGVRGGWVERCENDEAICLLAGQGISCEWK